MVNNVVWHLQKNFLLLLISVLIQWLSILEILLSPVKWEIYLCGHHLFNSYTHDNKLCTQPYHITLHLSLHKSFPSEKPYHSSIKNGKDKIWSYFIIFLIDTRHIHYIYFPLFYWRFKAWQNDKGVLAYENSKLNMYIVWTWYLHTIKTNYKHPSNATWLCIE